MTASGEPMHVLKEAAVFYLTQILLHPGADSYRTLGVSPDAPQEELRRNMAWLLRWLHPDLDQENAFDQYSRRVIRAWENVKTPERRAMYDKKRLLPKSGLLHHRPSRKACYMRVRRPHIPSHALRKKSWIATGITTSSQPLWSLSWWPAQLGCQSQDRSCILFNPFTVLMTDGGWLDRVLGR